MWNDNLAVILDSLSETGVYVIERDTHRLLYFNRRVKEVSPEVELGKRCHEVWEGTCSDCPLITIGDRTSNHTIHCHDPFGEVVDIIANKVMWEDTVPAYAIIITPHKLNDQEEAGIRRIEKMYRQSLVTVFGECIIANLTTDYYVNCQRSIVWTDIPERGAFAETNIKYSRMTVHPEDLYIFDKYFSREGMLKRFREGKKQIVKRLRRLIEDGSYHMAEFTATRIELSEEEDCWCVLVFRDIHEEFLQEQQINLELGLLATAVKVAYQMLISVNLTQNSYYMMEYDQFHTRKAAESGVFDDLITLGAETVHPDFREEFIRKFSRQSLLQAFEKGIRQVSIEMLQLGDDSIYHWNYTQVIKVESPYTDDILQITLSKCIDEERRQQKERLDKERKAKEMLEEALEKAENANNAKSDFLSKMSHDIRTPMNAVIGMTALAKAHRQEPEKLEDYLNKIEMSGNHLLGLINEVLDVSQIESGKATLEERNMDLRAAVEDVVLLAQSLTEQKQQELKVVIEEGVHTAVYGDEQRLRQVLLNIIENASKYTPPGGKVSLTLKETKKKEKTVGTYEFIVEDTGIGMDQDFMAHMFEPFSRAEDARISKISGTGLGLTIVRNLVQMMGGQICVESEHNKGTRFTLTFYLNKVNAPEKPFGRKRATGKTDFNGMRVLLAEDNELNRQIATEMLEMLNVTVETAQDGRQAVEAVLGNEPFYYALVFMDIQMPVMDGYQAAKKIRQSGKEGIDELPIVAMTADAFNEDVKKAGRAGMNGHMAKPIDIETIRSVLEACVERQKENNRTDKFL